MWQLNDNTAVLRLVCILLQHVCNFSAMLPTHINDFGEHANGVGAEQVDLASDIFAQRADHNQHLIRTSVQLLDGQIHQAAQVGLRDTRTRFNARAER